MNLIISHEVDITHAAIEAKNYAKKIGFSKMDQYGISIAVSELARNIFKFATKGTINMTALYKNAKVGIEVVAEDQGPGIKDIEKALQDHFSTSGTLGLGLPGTKRLMDEFEIDSKLDKGTKILIRKWMR